MNLHEIKGVMFLVVPPKCTYTPTSSRMLFPRAVLGVKIVPRILFILQGQLNYSVPSRVLDE
jgi:hypothetical protein